MQGRNDWYENERLHQIFTSIAFAFNSIYYIDLERDSFTAPVQTELAARCFADSGCYSELIKILSDSIIYPKDRELYRSKLSLDHVRSVVAEKKNQEFEYRSRMPDGTYHWLRNQIVGAGESKEDQKAVLFITDIHEQKLRELLGKKLLEEQNRKLALSEERFRIAMMHTSKILCEYDFQSKRVEFIASGPGEKNFLISLMDVKNGREIFGYHLVNGQKDLEGAIRRVHYGEKTVSFEAEIADTKGVEKWLNVTITGVSDHAGAVFKAIGLLEDITKHKRKAALDSLTGIYNKGATEKEITRRLQMERYIQNGVFFMIDLDNFKHINDTYGHKMGDAVIRECAKVLRSLCRGKDVVGRLGGDEFCLFFEGPGNKDQVCERAENVCMKFAQKMKEKFPEIYISTTIGISCCLGTPKNFAMMYEEADHALYRQKLNGRNGYCFYEE
ncbi:MAG: diguanylate cyclase domain-containing protein [Blautia sp.]|jgi:diguanylate cyclase (GGDEF)-like protein